MVSPSVVICHHLLIYRTSAYMNLAILIVTYNCSLTESTTLNSLLHANLDSLSSVQLTIWNNEPTLYRDDDIEAFKQTTADKRITATLYNTVGNFSLSKIYNNWISTTSATHYIILDHDDVFETDFFTKLHAAQSYDVVVPILKELNIQEITSPTLRERRKSEDYFPTTEGPFTGEKISALTSGLCLSKDFIEKFTKVYPTVFNENFALYRIDVCFFNDLTAYMNTYNNISIAICNVVYHSQSEYTQESAALIHFRALEHVYSGCLIRIHSRKKSVRSALRFLFFKSLGAFNAPNEFLLGLRCVITKKHPKLTALHNKDFTDAAAHPITLKK